MPRQVQTPGSPAHDLRVMSDDRGSAHPVVAAVRRLVPVVRVNDVRAPLDFDAQLGFVTKHAMHDALGHIFWVSAGTGNAEIMFARADGPIDPPQQPVLFYMDSPDVFGLRKRLLSQGLHDGGTDCGRQGPNGARRVPFDITRAAHMQVGELRIADPDAYCIFVNVLSCSSS